MDVISTNISFSFSCNHSSTLGNRTRALNIQQDIFDVLVLQVIDTFGLSLQSACSPVSLCGEVTTQKSRWSRVWCQNQDEHTSNCEAFSLFSL